MVWLIKRSTFNASKYYTNSSIGSWTFFLFWPCIFYTRTCLYTLKLFRTITRHDNNRYQIPWVGNNSLEVLLLETTMCANVNVFKMRTHTHKGKVTVHRYPVLVYYCYIKINLKTSWLKSIVICLVYESAIWAGLCRKMCQGNQSTFNRAHSRGWQSGAICWLRALRGLKVKDFSSSSLGSFQELFGLLLTWWLGLKSEHPYRLRKLMLPA